MESFFEARKEMEKTKKVKRTETVEVVLPNAVPGKVVVRFGQSAALCPYDMCKVCEETLMKSST